MKNLYFSYIQRYFTRTIRNLKAQENRVLVLFTVEGILFTLINNLISSNNYLFANRLGANDFALGLVLTLPQLVGVLVLIPGGILTDRMVNKRNMVAASLVFLTAAYVLIGFVPVLGEYRLVGFLALLAISAAPLTIYNVSWQAYFSDVVDYEDRNNILTARTGFGFLIGILIPLISGILLASAKTNDTKIILHQTFFWFAGIMLVMQIIALRGIRSDKVHVRSEIRLRDLKSALQELIHNKKFLGFLGVAIFFYMTWHVDWTLYFLGQVNYLGMNEAWLSYVGIGNSIIQFLSIGFWSRINKKKGVRFAIIFGSLGLAFCPISMIAATSVPAEDGRVIFLIMNTLANLTLATTSLNVIQCLLQVIPEKNKTLNISIYTVLVTLSNAVMPLIGVTIYTKIGADLQAMHRIFWIIFFFRIAATGLWAMRYWRLRKEQK